MGINLPYQTNIRGQSRIANAQSNPVKNHCVSNLIQQSKDLSWCSYRDMQDIKRAADEKVKNVKEELEKSKSTIALLKIIERDLRSQKEVAEKQVEELLQEKAAQGYILFGNFLSFF